MKKHHKITLASLATIIGIFAGILTVVEKSVALIGRASPQKAKREFSNVNELKDLISKFFRLDVKII